MDLHSFDVGAAAKVRFLVAPAVVSNTSRVRSLVRLFLSGALPCEESKKSLFFCFPL